MSASAEGFSLRGVRGVLRVRGAASCGKAWKEATVEVPLSQHSSSKRIFWMSLFYILSGYFSLGSLRVEERLQLKNVSVLMVDFSFLCCLSLLLLGVQGGRPLYGDGYGMPDRL